MLSLLQFTALMFFSMALAKGDSQSDLESRSAQDSSSNSYDLRSDRQDSSSSSYESRSARQDSRSYDSYDNESRSSPCRDHSMDDDYLDCGGNEYYDQYDVNTPPHLRPTVPTTLAITTTTPPSNKKFDVGNFNLDEKKFDFDKFLDKSNLGKKKLDFSKSLGKFKLGKKKLDFGKFLDKSKLI